MKLLLVLVYVSPFWSNVYVYKIYFCEEGLNF